VTVEIPFKGLNCTPTSRHTGFIPLCNELLHWGCFILGKGQRTYDAEFKLRAVKMYLEEHKGYKTGLAPVDWT
jgi:hypothetical protein